MTLEEYLQETENAIKSNPPRNNPAYQNDAVAMWKYYMRNFGAGLAAHDEKEARRAITSLYSRWFVSLEFHSQMPKINAKDFTGWILEAMQEGKRLTQPSNKDGSDIACYSVGR